MNLVSEIFVRFVIELLLLACIAHAETVILNAIDNIFDDDETIKRMYVFMNVCIVLSAVVSALI